MPGPMEALGGGGLFLMREVPLKEEALLHGLPGLSPQPNCLILAVSYRGGYSQTSSSSLLSFQVLEGP